jgi:hypothetical protein
MIERCRKNRLEGNPARFLSLNRTVPRPVRSGIRDSKRVSRHITQERCPYNIRFASDAVEPGYAARGPGEPPGGVEPLDTPEIRHPGTESPSLIALLGSLPGTEAPSLVELMRMSYEEWDVSTRGSAIRRAGYAGLKRNVAVAMGNWLAATDDPPCEALEVLCQARADEEPLVREHAAWALGRVPGAAGGSQRRAP